MTQQAKCLWCKPKKDLSSDPQNHVKAGHSAVHLQSQNSYRGMEAEAVEPPETGTSNTPPLATSQSHISAISLE